MEENKSFKPYIPAEKITPEFTVTSIVMGIILAIVFGAANAYLGLRVGMTVSASIPCCTTRGCLTRNRNTAYARFVSFQEHLRKEGRRLTDTFPTVGV